MTRFLDTEIAPAIKPTPPQKKIRVKMLTQGLGLMAGTYGIATVPVYKYRKHTLVLASAASFLAFRANCLNLFSRSSFSLNCFSSLPTLVLKSSELFCKKLVKVMPLHKIIFYLFNYLNGDKNY